MTRRTFGILLLLLFQAGSSFAQDKVVVSVPQQQREGVTEFTTASPITPLDVPFGDEWLVLRPDMNTATLQNPATVFQLQVWRSLDNGINWLHVASFGFRGSPEFPAGTAPGVAVEASKVAILGTRLKLRLDVPAEVGKVRLGATVILTRTPPG